MSSTQSPNMGLTIPGVGTEAGPDYANDINNSLNTIDQHDHTALHGVQITPNGLNINAALTLNNNLLTNSAGMTLLAQGSTPATGTIYRSGINLFYVDGNNTNIQLTASGGIAGSPGSISGLTSPASATFVSISSSFVWQSTSTAAANMDAGSILMRNLSPNSTFALTLSPPAALASNYTLTLPGIPSVTSFMTMTSAGAMNTGISTSQGITTSMLALGAVDTNQLAVGAVHTTNIANGAVDTNQLATQAVHAGNILNSTITGQQIAFNPILSSPAALGGPQNYPIMVSSAGATQTERVCWGSAAANGTLISGSGWTCTRGGVGSYTITFSHSFVNAPVATVQCFGTGGVVRQVLLGTLSASAITFNTLDSSYAVADSPFNFIAVGIM